MDRTEPTKSGRNRSSLTSGPRTFSQYWKHTDSRRHSALHNATGKTDSEDDWSRYLPSARLAWHELTEYELLNTRGNPGMLIRLVQERYAITYDEAQRQVQGFFDTHKF